jgi:hypothetical protein
VPQPSVEHLLDRLSERVQYFSLARSAGDLWLEEQNRIELCSLVETLLGIHLRRAPGWETSAWVDSVNAIAVDMSKTGTVVLSGAAVWRGETGWFLDPVMASFELSADLVSIRTYALQFGDAESGLGTVRYQPRSSVRAGSPTRWSFVFRESR